MTREPRIRSEKRVHWVGSSKKDFLEFPNTVRNAMGYALGVAQYGGKHPDAKPWKGEGPGIFEIVEGHAGDTYRALYAVRFADAIYVLHAFQKKSPSGRRTARADIALVRERLKRAREDYEFRQE